MEIALRDFGDGDCLKLFLFGVQTDVRVEFLANRKVLTLHIDAQHPKSWQKVVETFQKNGDTKAIELSKLRSRNCVWVVATINSTFNPLHSQSQGLIT